MLASKASRQTTGRKTTVVLLLLAVMLSACDRWLDFVDGSVPSPDLPCLSGYVVDSSNQERIPGATISLQELDTENAVPGRILSTTSSDAGRYSFCGPEPIRNGPHLLRAKHEGYMDYSASVQVEVSSTFKIVMQRLEQ